MGSRVDHNLNGSNHPLDGLAYRIPAGVARKRRPHACVAPCKASDC